MTIVDFSETTVRGMLMYMYGCLPDMPKRHYEVSQSSQFILTDDSPDSGKRDTSMLWTALHGSIVGSSILKRRFSIQDCYEDRVRTRFK